VYKHIMVPLDRSEVAKCVLYHVEVVAADSKVGDITLVRVITPLHLHGGRESGLSPEERKRLEVDSVNVAEDYLEGIVKQLRDKGIAAQSEVLFGRHVVKELSEYAKSHGVDLIIVATHGLSGARHLLRGSMADKLLRRAHVPVLMIHPSG
jgi:nucleotide-binding universal stress UspA family protein